MAPSTRRYARSGLDVLRFLRLHDQFAHIPVLLRTGYGLSDSDRRLAETHRAKVFSKPDGYPLIRAELDRLMGRAP